MRYLEHEPDHSGDTEAKGVGRRDLLAGAAGLAGGLALGPFGPVLAEAATHAATRTSAAGPERYVMVTFLSGIDFWKPAFRGMQDAARFLGVTARYQGTPQYDALAEATVLGQVAATKPSGIIVTAQNPDALLKPINTVIDSGIPLVMFDSDSPKSKRPFIAQVNNEAGGAAAARIIGAGAHGKGSVGIVTTPGQFNLDLRAKGFTDTLKNEFPQMKVIAQCKGLGNPTDTANCVNGWLQRPDLSGIFSTGSDGGYNAVPVLKAAGKLKNVTIVNFDIDPASIQGIQRGEIAATIVQGAYHMGFWSMMAVYALAHKLTRPVANYQAAHISPLPASLDGGVLVANKSNVGYLTGLA